MPLLSHDQAFLDERGFNYTIQELPGETILIIKDYPISDIYDKDKTDILIKIPNGYPMANLDMFWVEPYIKVKALNSYPNCADVFETYVGQSWQRFSRHYSWKPSYSLATHLNIVKDELVNKRG